MERERNEMRAKMEMMEQREEELRKRSKKLEVCPRTRGSAIGRRANRNSSTRSGSGCAATRRLRLRDAWLPIASNPEA